MQFLRSRGGSLASVVLGLATLSPAAYAGPTLDGVKGRGVVTCAVNTGLAGFAMPDRQGNYQGLDADTCRAIAAAVKIAGQVRYPHNSTAASATPVGGQIGVALG